MWVPKPDTLRLYQVRIQLHMKNKTTPFELLLCSWTETAFIARRVVTDADSSFLFRSAAEGGSGLDSVPSQA